MKQLKSIIILFFIFISICMNSQNIVLNACHPLTENQDYIFNQKTTDATGRNIFETNPIDENSPCGGIGNCEFQIAWNQTNNRWEIYADDGNGTFANKYVLYYNTEASTPNPPSSTLGVWVEETLVTQSLCGLINSITGDVQNTTLGIDTFNINDKLIATPNPSPDFIQISGLTAKKKYRVYSTLGLEIQKGTVSNNEKIDIRNFNYGLYFLKFDNGNTIKFIKE